MDESVFKIIVASIFLILFAFAFYGTGKFVYHMYKMIKNVTGKNASFLSAFLLVMPSQFSEEGNLHRVKLLRLLPWLVISYILLFGLNLILEFGR